MDIYLNIFIFKWKEDNGDGHGVFFLNRSFSGLAPGNWRRMPTPPKCLPSFLLDKIGDRTIRYEHHALHIIHSSYKDEPTVKKVNII